MKNIKLLKNNPLVPLTLGLTSLILASCNSAVRTAEEQAVLASSAFYQDEVAASVAAVTGESGVAGSDSGTITGPDGNSGNSGDGGVIPPTGGDDPGDGDVGSVPPGTGDPSTPPLEDPPVVGDNSNDPPPMDDNPPLVPDPTQPGTPGGDPIVDNGDTGNDPNNGTPGSDGGTIGGGDGPGDSGPDGGTIADNDPPVNNDDPGTIAGEDPPTTDDPPVVGDNDPPTTDDPPTGDDPPVVGDNDPPGTDDPNPDGGDVADNTPPGNDPGDDGGTIDPPGDGPGDDPDGGTIPGANEELVEYKITRVCSQWRSDNPNFLFFEEADDRILSIVATMPERLYASKTRGRYAKWFKKYMKKRKSKWAALGFGTMNTEAEEDNRPRTFLLKAVDLSQVDLFAGPFSGAVAVDLTELKTQYPNSWQQATIKLEGCNDSNGDGLCAGEQPNLLTMHSTTFKADHVPSELEIPMWHGRYKNSHNHPDYCERQYSPLVLDIKGNGFKLSAAEDSGVYFDLNNTGSPVYTGWVASDDDFFLTRDLNGNGRIDDGGELFGSATIMNDGSRAENGFEALRELDSNQDGQITSHDRDWDTLLLWRDRNFDGETDRGELYRPSQVKLQSMDLNYVEIQEVDPHGNQTRQRSTYRRKVRRASVVRQIVDIWFRTITPW